MSKWEINKNNLKVDKASIEKLAYLIWVSNGKPIGQDKANWNLALGELESFVYLLNQDQIRIKNCQAYVYFKNTNNITIKSIIINHNDKFLTTLEVKYICLKRSFCSKVIKFIKTRLQRFVKN